MCHILMNKVFQIFAFSLLILKISRVNGQDDYCYFKDKNPYKMFSDLTLYGNVKGYLNTEILPEHCEPYYVWSLSKHGIQYISKEEIQRSRKLIGSFRLNMKSNYENRLTSLCWEDFYGMSKWYYTLDEKKDQSLARAALSEQELFASYLKHFIDDSSRRSSSAFEVGRSSSAFEFATSKSEDAKVSAKVFLKQLLGIFEEESSIKENPTLLPQNSDCSTWTASHKEFDDFITSIYIDEMLMRMSNRLGFLKPITFVDAIALYESCAYWHILPTVDYKSPFCAALTKEDLKVLEYAYDIKHYYYFGYGNPRSEKIGCPLVKDLISKLTEAARDPNGQKGTFYIANAEHTNGLLVALGLYQDSAPLLYSNYQQMKNSRKWKSSLIDPYFSNLHAVLFKCNNNEKRVEFYHNGHVVTLPGCPENKQKCPLDTFLGILQQHLKNGECEDNSC